MRLARFCVFMTGVLATLGTVRADGWPTDLPSKFGAGRLEQSEPVAQIRGQTPGGPRVPEGQAVAPVAWMAGTPTPAAGTPAAAGLDARELLNLAGWARSQVGPSGQGLPGISARDVQELEAWARAHGGLEVPLSHEPRPLTRSALKLATQSRFLTDETEPVQLTAPLEGEAPIVTPQDEVTGVPAEEIEPGLGPDLLWGSVWNACYTCCQSGVVSGVEGTFLAPFGEPSQLVVQTDLESGLVYPGGTDPGLGAGVRTWLGFQHDGWGYRFRYWHFGNDAVDPDPVLPILGTNAIFNEIFHLSADTVDLELTQRFCFGRWNIDTSLGGRYARLERNATVLGYGTLGNVDLFGLAVGANELEGAGFTFSLSAADPIECYCGWSWFWGSRISLLWADTTAAALTEANAVVRPPFGAAVANSRDKAFASQDHSESIFIAEALLGIRYERCLTCLPASIFFHAACEYQHWETGDVFARTNSFAFLQGGPPDFGGRVDAFSEAHDGDLDLIGFTIGGGLNY